MRDSYRIRFLEYVAGKIRLNVLRICKIRGGYAAQGVALADIAACLYFEELRTDDEGNYYDRFVLSNGHDAIMTYAALYEAEYYTMDELRTYNENGTRVDQSPIEGQLGFEITAGSLGQGPSQAAGLAWGLRQQGSDRRVYCLCSDGELQEGNVWEGAMFAAHHNLDNLCLIVDNNDMQATGHTGDVMGVEPVDDKFTAFGFQTRRISGTDMAELMDTFEEARNTKGKPFVMICDTRLWHGIDCLQEALPMAHYVAKDAVDWKKGFEEIYQKLKIMEEEI